MGHSGSRTVQVDALAAAPFAGILCYPSGSIAEAGRRVQTLKEIGVEALVFTGRTEINGIRILGKGHVGVVVRCIWKGGGAAIKVRRTDADRDGLEREGQILGEANRWNLGPRLIVVRKDFLVMEELVGLSLVEWLEASGTVGDAEFRKVIVSICGQARELDVAGIDHKELSDPRHHIIIQADGTARVLDFETAGMGGMKRNVNGLVQFLTLSGPYGPRLMARLGAVRDEVLGSLRTYRKTPDEVSYSNILRAMKLA